MTVELTASEMYFAAMVGVRRYINVRKGAHRSPLAENHDVWGNNIEGACGELAFAKAVNIYWDGSINTFKMRADVGLVEVRTRRKAGYELIVRDSDPDGRVFVLVQGEAPRFTVMGWYRSEQAKRPEWLQTHGGGSPAYFVPNGHLYPISTLTLE